MFQDNNVFIERKWGDPVRVKASFNSHSKKIDGHIVPEYRKFSVDPQLTNYEVLRSLLARAFDIHSDFLIQYRLEDPSGQELFLQLLSDWDLEAAFVSAADPYLCLRIDPIPLEQTVEEWDLVNIPSGDYRIIQTKETSSDPSLHTKFLTKVEKTISLMQQALNLNAGGDDENSVGSSTPQLTDAEFTEYRNGVGTLVKFEELKKRIFQGGLEPSLRRVVWKHLLNVYPEGLNGTERMNYIRRKVEEYRRLKSGWMSYHSSKQMSEDLKNISSMVRKDVLRTDRQHPFYSGGDDNPNVEELFNILTTYALYHPSVGYCQGMSDIASPILFVMGNESHAYITFTALMERLKDNFLSSGTVMTLKFEHLSSALAYYDPVFFSYLQHHKADDLLFCYRWLLLEMKREFSFDDALRMLEVMWSSLPTKPRQDDLPLFEIIPEFHSSSKPIPCHRVKETPYIKVCALRRQGSSTSSGSANSSFEVSNTENQVDSVQRIVSLNFRRICERSATLEFNHRTSDILAEDRAINDMNNENSSKNSRDELKSLCPEHVTCTAEDSQSGNFNMKFYTDPGDPSTIMNEVCDAVSNVHSSHQIECSSSLSYNTEDERFTSFDGGLETEDQENGQQSMKTSLESGCVEELDDQYDFIFSSETSSIPHEENLLLNENQSKPRLPITGRIVKQLTTIFDPSTKSSGSKSPGKENSLGSVVSSIDVIEKLRKLSKPRSDYLAADNAKATNGALASDIELIASCEEATEAIASNDKNFSNSSSNSSAKEMLPPPETFGCGNPFLMFLCITVLSQHRDFIMDRSLDSNELAMHFDRLVRKHNLERVLSQARTLYYRYLRQFGYNVPGSPKKNVNV